MYVFFMYKYAEVYLYIYIPVAILFQSHWFYRQMSALAECEEGKAMDVRIREYVQACLITAVNNHPLITWKVPLPSAQGSRVYGLATASSDLDLYVIIEGSDVIGRESSVLLAFQAALLAKGYTTEQADSWCDTSYHTSWKDVETKCL